MTNTLRGKPSVEVWVLDRNGKRVPLWQREDGKWVDANGNTYTMKLDPA